MFKPLRKDHVLLSMLNKSMVDLPAPVNISIWWNYGSLLGMMLVVQVITGLFLSMHYCANVELAFNSVMHITNDIDYGWLLRFIHANGASMFFIFIYMHIGRGIYYMSYNLMETWNIGSVLFILSIATAFMGYVLPWGQMSFWGATVITNLLSTVPYVGGSIVQWVWGGFSVGNPTLNRFYTFHFILPFIMVAFVAIHLLFLHQTGSNNPLGVNSDSDRVSFHYYYSYKDSVGFVLSLWALLTFVMFYPNLLNDPENFTMANSSVTPTHIKPEWYFLWIYAILRSIPNKLGGVVAAFSGILIIFVLPMFSNTLLKTSTFYSANKYLFIFLIISFIVLTWIGGCPVEDPYIIVGQLFTFIYFLYYLMLLPTMLIFDYFTL